MVASDGGIAIQTAFLFWYLQVFESHRQHIKVYQHHSLQGCTIIAMARIQASITNRNQTVQKVAANDTPCK